VINKEILFFIYFQLFCIYFFFSSKACAEILEHFESSKYIAAVRELARWRLAAVQTQLNAVVSAPELLAAVHQSKKGEPERKMVIPNFPMEVQHPDTIVKVLEPDEIQKPIRVKKTGAAMEFGTGCFMNSIFS
jgi:hypothetical protein